MFPLALAQGLVAHIIGKGGMNVKKIAKDSKASIVMRSRDNGDGDVVITGKPKDVAVSLSSACVLFLLSSSFS